jgi:hypothetical protein
MISLGLHHVAVIVLCMFVFVCVCVLEIFGYYIVVIRVFISQTRSEKPEKNVIGKSYKKRFEPYVVQKFDNIS